MSHAAPTTPARDSGLTAPTRVGSSEFVRPFKRENTKLWRDRERIRNVLRRISDNADEAWLCLEKAEREEHDISQASTALGELETAINELKP